MSNEIQNLCWPLKLRPVSKSVLIYLATRADDDGCCWPPISNIEESTCYKGTAVLEALRDLENGGFFRVDRSRRNNTYFLQVAKLRAAKDSAQRTKREARKSPARGRRTPPHGAEMVRQLAPKGPPAVNHTSTVFNNTTPTQKSTDLFARFLRFQASQASTPVGEQGSAEGESDDSISRERRAMRGRN